MSGMGKAHSSRPLAKMLISVRDPGGRWKDLRNQDWERCDLCGDRLWVAPHGGIYCDRTAHSDQSRAPNRGTTG
jgi:hypothetical protein